MPLDHMHADALNDKEPQRVNNILFNIVGVLDDDLLTLALESFPLPKTNNGVIELSHLNEKRKYAGNPVFEDLTVVYKDLIQSNVARAIFNWRKEVYDPATGKIGFAADYKKSGFMTMYAPNGTMDRQYEVFGCWPSSFDPGDADMSGEDYIRITLTITIDKCVPGSGIANG